MMNKISFIIEFDEVSKTQNEQLTEFIKKTGIKFQVLESDNDLKKYKKYKEVIDKVRKLIEKHYYKESDDYYDYFTEGVCLQDGDYNELEDILKEVE